LISNSTAIHTRMKPTQRPVDITSSNTKYPNKNWAIGAMYWNIPTVDNGKRAAAPAKSTSGTTVIIPTTGKEYARTVSKDSKTPIPVAVAKLPSDASTIHTVEGIDNHMVSTVRPVKESTVGPSLFFTKP